MTLESYTTVTSLIVAWNCTVKGGGGVPFDARTCGPAVRNEPRLLVSKSPSPPHPTLHFRSQPFKMGVSTPWIQPILSL